MDKFLTPIKNTKVPSAEANRGPFQHRFALHGIFMSRDKGYGRRQRPMRDGNPRVRRHCHRRGHARHHFKWNLMLRDPFSFFPPSSEYKRISAFQSHHAFSRTHFRKHQLIDFVLRPVGSSARTVPRKCVPPQGRRSPTTPDWPDGHTTRHPPLEDRSCPEASADLDLPAHRPRDRLFLQVEALSSTSARKGHLKCACRPRHGYARLTRRRVGRLYQKALQFDLE